jgi:type I restriction enzyme S subunit
LDEGSLGLLTATDAALISPMYTVFEVNTERVYPPFLYRALKSPHMIAAYSRLGKGSVHRRKAISFERLASLPLFLPPLPEQRRIADLLDKADAISRKRKEVIALTEELLRSTFLEMFGDPVINPKSWPVFPFREFLAMPLRNGLSPASSGLHPARVLTLAAITGRRYDASASKDGMFAVEPWADVRVDPRDFLICRGNGNKQLVGRGAFPGKFNIGLVFPDTMIAARLKIGTIAPAFLDMYWKSSSVRRQIQAGARTTNGTFKINQGLVEAIDVFCPPRKLQERFQAFANIASRSTTKGEESAIAAEQLFKSLADRSFGAALASEETAAC